jgi:hypothetical protein
MKLNPYDLVGVKWVVRVGSVGVFFAKN